jgi:hypothetical protein
MVAGQPEDISVVLANLQSIASVLNGNIDDSNLLTGGHSPSKLSPGPTNSKLVTLSGPPVWTPDVGYGTSLPSSPVDGQEYVLVDSVTNNSFQWRFRYNAAHAGDGNKWEFIGGAPLLSGPQGNQVQTWAASPTWTALPGSPTFTVPRSGVYAITRGIDMQSQAAGASTLFADISPTAAGAGVTGKPCTMGAPAQWARGSVAMQSWVTCTAGQAWTFYIQSSPAITWGVFNAWISVVPWAVI